MDAALAAPHIVPNADKPQILPTIIAASVNENGNGVQNPKLDTKKTESTNAAEANCNIAEETKNRSGDDHNNQQNEVGNEKVLITICNANRKNKKSFMSLPTRKDVIEKAHKYGLAGTTIVLESNGCEICEDEVLLFASKEKLLLMLLAENDEYIILPPPSPLNRSERAGSSVDPSFYMNNSIASNANDSTVSNDETLSLASMTQSASNSKQLALFKDFSIPWSKVPNDIMKLLRSKQSVGKRLTTLANFLVDVMRERSENIPTRALRQIAQQAAEKYPDSLLEKDREGQFIDTIPQTLIAKMINRNNASTRPQKRSNSSGTFQVNIASKKRKLSKSNTTTNGGSGGGGAGSIAISPALSRDLEEKKALLISSYRGITTVDEATIVEYMKECFPLQRTFFNNSEKIPDITAIKDNWPYIFKKEMLYQHFKVLMSIDPHKLEKHFIEEKDRFFKFFKTSKNKKISGLEENNANMIRGLAYHFNEDPDYIFKQLENITEHINPTNAPWVALITGGSGDGGDHQTEAMIYIEGKIMATFPAKDTDLPDIIAQLLCYFYTFNMMYPKEATQTLEFIVLYFLQYTPEMARNTKKGISNNSKYNQLIAKLANVGNG